MKQLTHPSVPWNPNHLYKVGYFTRWRRTSHFQWTINHSTRSQSRDQLLNPFTLTKKGRFLCWPMQKRGLKCHCPWWRCWGWRQTFPKKSYLESGETKVCVSAGVWNRAQECPYTPTCRLCGNQIERAIAVGALSGWKEKKGRFSFFTLIFWSLPYRFCKLTSIQWAIYNSYLQSEL